MGRWVWFNRIWSIWFSFCFSSWFPRFSSWFLPKVSGYPPVSFSVVLVLILDFLVVLLFSSRKYLTFLLLLFLIALVQLLISSWSPGSFPVFLQKYLVLLLFLFLIARLHSWFSWLPSWISWFDWRRGWGAPPRWQCWRGQCRTPCISGSGCSHTGPFPVSL